MNRIPASIPALVMVLLLTLLISTTGGCPQTSPAGDPNSPDDTAQDEPNIPSDTGNNDDTTPPSATAQLLEGPGFEVTVPEGFTLLQDEPQHPSYSFWHYYEDAYGTIGIAVGVLKGQGGASSNYEDLSMRVKGALLTASEDFLLVCRIKTDDLFGAEIEGVVGRLADGRALVVLMGSTYLTGTDELLANTVFTSIDLTGTDGYELEQTWIDTTPELLAKTDEDLLVLSDGSVWEVPSSASFADQSEVQAWRVGDHVFPQTVTEYFLDQEELIHVGRWRPVDMYFLDFATRSEIAAQVDEWTIALSDGSRWEFTWAVPAAWSVGDAVFYVDDWPLGQWLIHAPTGEAVLFY